MMESIKKFALTLNEYLYSLRVARLVSFGYSALAVILFAGVDELRDNLNDILIIFVTIGFFVYGGLYSLNKYFDLEEDLNTSYKKGLSIKKGIIPHEWTFFIGVVHIITGYVGVLIFLPKLYIVTFVLILINLFYTIYLKKKNRILAITLVASTGPLKSLIGITLVSTITPNVVIYMTVHYLFSIVIHAVKQGYKQRMERALIDTLAYIAIILAIGLSIYGALQFGGHIPIIATGFGLLYLALFKKDRIARLFLR